MIESPERSGPAVDLIGLIGQVRQRWRTKLAVRGAVIVAVTAAIVFFAAAYGLQWARFSATAIITSRVLLLLALVASALWFVVRPLRRRVTDEQVALYLEEHEPALQARVLSAVEASQAGCSWESSALVRRLIEEAIEHCVRHDAVRRVESTTQEKMGRITAGMPQIPGMKFPF